MKSSDVATRRETARRWAQQIRAEFRTVILATTSIDAEPDASVAGAIIAGDGAFLVYASRLAAHTRNLLATRRASVLVIEDEAAAAQPLARRRLTFQCLAAPVPREDAAHAPALAALRTRLGPTFDLISSLGDFQLFRLVPQAGRLVAGFGQAYEVNPVDWTPRDAPLGPP